MKVAGLTTVVMSNGPALDLRAGIIFKVGKVNFQIEETFRKTVHTFIGCEFEESFGENL